MQVTKRTRLRRTATIVGAGLGGLSLAIRLAHRGWEVTVLEKNATVGGRCSSFREDGYTFDTGPTLLLMRDVLDELFTSVGHRLEDFLELIQVNPNYRIHFSNGASIEFSRNLDRMEGELEAFEPGAGRAFRRYLADAGYKYRVSRGRFVERNFRHLHEFATPANLYYLFATNTLRKLDVHARRYFRDPRLVAAFTFQTMYLGLAPHRAPAVYSLLPYTELCEGIWFPRGGMYRLAETLATLAQNLGVRIETGCEVSRIVEHRGSVKGVELADGARLYSDVVISNADLPYTYGSLVSERAVGRVQRARLRRLNYGSSAFLMYIGLDREVPQLNHHDVYLSGDVAGNFDAIFKRHELPADPSFYTCVASRTDRSLAPTGGDGLYVLVPVPHLSDRVDWEREREPFARRMYARLADIGVGDIRKHVVFERLYTPADFARDYNVYKGSAFGLSHGFSQVGYMRPANAAKLHNLYFVGASTVPGGGVPMVVIGSRLTAERVNEEALRA